jgi:putative flippase GtrA
VRRRYASAPEGSDRSRRLEPLTIPRPTDLAGRHAARGAKFVLTGLLGAGIAYGLFMGLLRLMPWPPAMALSWIGSIWFGFVVNRRFTFEVTGAQRRTRQAGLYLVGALLQLALSYVVYGLLHEVGHWTPTPAFLATTAVTAAFGFAFQSLVTFRRAPAAV